MRLVPSLRLALALLIVAGCDGPVFVPDHDAGARPTGRTFPERPRTVDADDGAPTVYVLRDMRIGAGASLGWNIDGRCSFTPDPPTDPWDVECAPNDENVEDLEMCVDDSFGVNLAGAFRPLGALLEAENALALSGGSHVYLLRLSEWSGEGDDPLVRVELARSLYGVPNGGVRGDPVLWDELDTFTPIAEGFDRAGDARTRDTEAYVADRVLVARLPEDTEILLHAGSRSLLFRLTEATLTARLDGTLSDVVISGRWRVDRFLAELDMVGVCDDHPVRSSVELRARDAADVRTDARGGPGMNAPCESLSVKITFEVYVGLWGASPEPEVARPEPCAPP